MRVSKAVGKTVEGYSNCKVTHKSHKENLKRAKVIQANYNLNRPP